MQSNGKMMTKPIVISKQSWNNIKNKIQKDQPASVLLIRDRMKFVLGFTPREHTEWSIGDDHYNTTVRLDFFDEKKRIMFLLRYSDLIHEKDYYE